MEGLTISGALNMILSKDKFFLLIVGSEEGQPFSFEDSISISVQWGRLKFKVGPAFEGKEVEVLKSKVSK